MDYQDMNLRINELPRFFLMKMQLLIFFSFFQVSGLNFKLLFYDHLWLILNSYKYQDLIVENRNYQLFQHL